MHPSFFPLDPFHLFYENCLAFIWALWMKSVPSDLFYILSDKLKRFGELVAQASSSTLPASFCGPVRDPFLKSTSQYKIYEWMALLHWYIIPIGIELQFNDSVLSNFAHFVYIVEFAMTITPRSQKDIRDFHHEIVKFLKGFQSLYVGNDPNNISRACLCIFQLIHVPRHIAWNGSIRLGSQATCERTIGEMSHRIHSKKAVFANLSNQIYERELLKLMLLYYPTLDSDKNNSNSSQNQNTIRGMSSVRIPQREKVIGTIFAQHMDAIHLFLGKTFNLQQDTSRIIRWGKVCIGKGIVIPSRLSESRSQSSTLRHACWFEVYKLLLLLSIG